MRGNEIQIDSEKWSCADISQMLPATMQSLVELRRKSVLSLRVVGCVQFTPLL